jgi:glucose-1-phosphate thymidylyltransferase
VKAIILCGGYATRLYPLTKFIAKQLLPVNGKPVLNNIINKLDEIKEIDEIFITTNKKFYPQFEEWLEAHKHLFKKKIRLFKNIYLFKPQKIGGVDDILKIANKYNVKGDILVIAGDNLFDFSLKPALKFFKEKQSTVVLLNKLKNKRKASSFGVVKLSKKNKIISFEEKPKKPKSDIISTAIYFFPRKDIDIIKHYARSEHKGDSFGYFLNFLYKKQNVFGFVPKGKFFDIGTIEDYKKANKIWRN